MFILNAFLPFNIGYRNGTKLIVYTRNIKKYCTLDMVYIYMYVGMLMNHNAYEIDATAQQREIESQRRSFEFSKIFHVIRRTYLWDKSKRLV